VLKQQKPMIAWKRMMVSLKVLTVVVALRHERLH
jgi:hypothetical protein